MSAETVGPRLLLDVNVVLDVLQRREPFFAEASRVLAAAETGRVRGIVAAHTVTTLFYLVAKYESADAARVQITELLEFLEVAPVDEMVLQKALALPYRHFEDAVQMMAAVRAEAEYLVTRNVGNYAAGPLPAVSPAEVASLLATT